MLSHLNLSLLTAQITYSVLFYQFNTCLMRHHSVSDGILVLYWNWCKTLRLIKLITKTRPRQYQDFEVLRPSQDQDQVKTKTLRIWDQDQGSKRQAQDNDFDVRQDQDQGISRASEDQDFEVLRPSQDPKQHQTFIQHNDTPVVVVLKMWYILRRGRNLQEEQCQ